MIDKEEEEKVGEQFFQKIEKGYTEMLPTTSYHPTIFEMHLNEQNRSQSYSQQHQYHSETWQDTLFSCHPSSSRVALAVHNET